MDRQLTGRKYGAAVSNCSSGRRRAVSNCSSGRHRAPVLTSKAVQELAVGVATLSCNSCQGESQEQYCKKACHRDVWLITCTHDTDNECSNAAICCLCIMGVVSFISSVLMQGVYYRRRYSMRSFGKVFDGMTATSPDRRRMS